MLSLPQAQIAWITRLVLAAVGLLAASLRDTHLAAQTSAVHQPESLAIGKVAPEIEGTDLDGVAFKNLLEARNTAAGDD